jgi:uncharacterized membrane protein
MAAIPTLAQLFSGFRDNVLPHRVFLWCGLLGGLVFIFLVPPFWVADEPSHFLRAYDVSRGHIWPEVVHTSPGGAYTSGTVGADLPRSLLALEHELPAGPGATSQPATILRSFRYPLNPDDRIFVDFRGTAWSPFLPYVAPALAIALGRWCGAGPLLLLYLGRLANLLASSLLIALAIRRFPTGRWVQMLIALTPMAITLRASLSADAAAFTAACVFVGLVAEASSGSRPLRGGDLAVLICAGAALALTKLPYIPLLLLALSIPAERFSAPSRRRFLTSYGAIALAAVLFSIVCWRRIPVAMRPDVDPAIQIHSLVAHPLSVLQVLAHDIAQSWLLYLMEALGALLGWLDIGVSPVIIHADLFLIVLMLMLDAEASGLPSRRQRWLLLTSVTTVAFLVLVSQFVSWTEPGHELQGVQGRYFLPIAPATALLLQPRSLASRWSLAGVGPWLAAFTATLFAIVSLAVIDRCYH